MVNYGDYLPIYGNKNQNLKIGVLRLCLFEVMYGCMSFFLGDGAGLFVARPAAGFLSAVERSIVGMFVWWGESKWEVSEFDCLTLLRKTDPNCAMRMRIFW